jgi:hypothetical protein
MRSYWISTIWPIVGGDQSRCCHVFLKERRKTFPQVGDAVFFRESISTPSHEITRIERGRQTQVRVNKGCGGIIAGAVVSHPPINIPSYPEWVVVYNYGNLKEWTRVIRCADHRFGKWMAWEELSESLCTKNGMFLNLYRLRDKVLIDQLTNAVGFQ